MLVYSLSALNRKYFYHVVCIATLPEIIEKTPNTPLYDPWPFVYLALTISVTVPFVTGEYFVATSL